MTGKHAEEGVVTVRRGFALIELLAVTAIIAILAAILFAVFGLVPPSLPGYEAPVCSVAFSPYGLWLASGSWDNTLRLWDAQTGECLWVFEGHEGLVNSVAFSPDWRYLASGSVDDTLRLWDAQTGQCLRVFEGHKRRGSMLSFGKRGGRFSQATSTRGGFGI